MRRREASLVQQRIARAIPFAALYQADAVDLIPARLHGFKSSSLSPFWNVVQWRLDAKAELPRTP